MDLVEKKISSTSIYDGKVVKLFVDDIELPNGEKGKRELIKHLGAVAAVPIIDGNIILVKQYRYATGQVLLELPAGKIDPGEDPRMTIERELKEEIGYWPRKLTILNSAFYAPGYSGEKVHVYLAEDMIPQTANKDGDEFLELVQMPFEEAHKKAMYGMMEDAKTTVGILLAGRYLL